MHYYSLNEYLKNTFGEKVYKLDGTLGTRGCIFCSAGGSGEFAACRALSVSEQLAQAKARVAAKSDCRKFIAYFQPFSNTYAPVGYLRRIFEEAMAPDEIVALSVATRPDCLGEDVLALLGELNRRKPVWVELGLQRLHDSGITVITHVILGLPGESRADMLATVRYAGERSDGIKLQLLHVLKGTDLLRDYERGMFETMSLEEYADLVCDCIGALPPHVVIHRLTGDGDKKLLVAPLWSGDKKRVLNTINKIVHSQNVIQGGCY